MRRLLLALTVVGLSLATLTPPAAGQSALVNIDSFSPTCEVAGQSVSISLAGQIETDSATVTLRNPAGGVLQSQGVQNNGFGRWSANLRPFVPTANGDHEIRIVEPRGTQDFALFRVPCPRPLIALDPTCFVPGRTNALTVNASRFSPKNRGYVYFDYVGPNTYGDSRIRIPIDGRGSFSASFSPLETTPSRRDYPIHAEDLDDNVADAVWSPCPPPGVTTTSTSAPPPDDTPATTSTTETPTVSVPPTVTVTFPDRPGTVTTTTSTTIPPVTPGATLAVTPGLGPPGFVTIARGTGFPEGVVDLTWLPGLGRVSPVAGADGTFSVQVLIFPKDRVGPRTLVATGSGTTATASFLVVPPTVQPSGSDVTQITRIRRFNQR